MRGMCRECCVMGGMWRVLCDGRYVERVLCYWTLCSVVGGMKRVVCEDRCIESVV